MRVKGAAFEGASKQEVSAVNKKKCASTSTAADSEPKQNGKKNKQAAKQSEQPKTAQADLHKQLKANAQSSANTCEFSAEFLARFSHAWSMTQPNTNRSLSTGSQVGRVSPPLATNYARSVHCKALTDQANSGGGGVAGIRQPNSGKCYRCNEARRIDD